MDAKNLVHMVNRIGDFFQTMPDENEALDGIVDHLHKFWDPRMRHALATHLDTKKGEGLKPFVLRALESRREKWR